MRSVLMLMLVFSSFGVTGQDSSYCQLSGDRGASENGFESRFCFGTKEYMEAFARALTEKDIPHVVYPNGDIGTRSGDKAAVQEIGDSLLNEYIFNKSGG